MEAIIVGKWTVGYTFAPAEGFTLLTFHFTDREPLTFAIPPESAEAIAKAMLEQLKNPPPKRDRLS